MNKTAFAGPWIGEFGWEIMTWQSYLRRLSREYDKMIISTFPGMEALYEGFHCEVEFMPHQHPGRALDWRDTSMVELGFDIPEGVEMIAPIKQFRVEGEFVRYGTPFEPHVEVLFHARDIKKSSSKNWSHEKWDALAASFQAASVGTAEDYHIPGTVDRRGIPLQDLMDLMASSQVIVGQSSGVMHLASLCGLRQVVWGDNKTYFGQTLERRYKKIWNPLSTPVGWVETEAWDPEIKQVMETMLDRAETGGIAAEILNHLRRAGTSGRYMVSIAHLDRKDDKDTLESFSQAVGLSADNIAEAIGQIKKDMDTLLKKHIDVLRDQAGMDGNGKGGDAWL